MEFLFEHVHGHVGLFHDGCFLLRLRKRTLVHLLVLVERNGINLHGDGGNHIWRLLVEDELVEGLDIDLLVADDVGGNELASAIFIECLDRSVLDSRELTDDAFHLLEFDAETANLHLSVATAHKLDVAIGQEANDVTRAIGAQVFLFGGEGIGDIDLSRLLGTVQVASAHLWSGNPKFTGSTDGQTVSVTIDHIEAHVSERLSDGNLLHLMLNGEYRSEDRALGRTIDVVEVIARGRSDGRKFLTACREVEQRVVLDACGKLVTYLGGHE